MWSDDARLMRRLRPDSCGEAYRPPRELRVVSCTQTGELSGMFLHGDCPVAELDRRGLMVLELDGDGEQRTVRFALRELAAVGDRRLGACGEMELRVGSAAGLCALAARMRWPGELTFRGMYEALQGEIEAIWRGAAEELRAGAPWTRDDWVRELRGLPPLAWNDTARLLMGYGLILPPGKAVLRQLAPDAR